MRDLASPFFIMTMFPNRTVEQAMPPLTYPCPPHLLGPDAEEYADFERASKPRPIVLTSGGVLSVLAALLMFLLVAFASIYAVAQYNANQPRNLIVGSWKSVDHPEISSLEFTNHGRARVSLKSGGSNAGVPYRFISRQTVEIDFFALERHDLTTMVIQVHFDGQAMTTQEKHNKSINHWQRLR
jgi:hypothetical protein